MLFNLDPHESVILEVRKHWFVFLWQILAFLFGALIPLAGYIAVHHFNLDGITVVLNRYDAVFWFAYSVWLMGIWISFCVQWTNYYLDVWYVTQKRIIDVDQKHLFHREVSNLRFDKIQDISIEVRGFVATFLNFGDIRVQTAGEDSSEFFMKDAHNPERVRTVIFAQHNREAEKPVQVTLD